MALGTIAHLSKGGYGFIECSTCRVLYFYGSDVEQMPLDALHVGDRVEFDTKGNERWRDDRALHVRRVEAQPR